MDSPRLRYQAYHAEECRHIEHHKQRRFCPPAREMYQSDLERVRGLPRPRQAQVLQRRQKSLMSHSAAACRGCSRMDMEEQREPGPAGGHAQVDSRVQLLLRMRHRLLARPRRCLSIIQKARSRALSIEHPGHIAGGEETSSE